jgi:hypothetical protein
MLSLGLFGCATGTGGPATEGQGAAAALDLTGEWEQANDGGNGSSHAATIVGDTITIYWVSEDDTKSLYWAGNVEVPVDPGAAFSWDSVNDKSKTDLSLLASQAETKVFSYNNKIISYEAGALGQTWTVELRQTSTTPAAVPAAQESPKSDFDVKIEGAAFTSDYDGKPVIVVSFAFTNNSDEAESFMFAVNAQAFQGGIELSDMVFGLDDIDSSLTMADIQPGVTVAIQQPYLLRDNSTVTVEVREAFSFSDAMLTSQEFSVGN